MPGQYVCTLHYPDSKVHGAYIGPAWGRQDPCWPHDPCYLGNDGRLWVVAVEFHCNTFGCRQILTIKVFIVSSKFDLLYILAISTYWVVLHLTTLKRDSIVFVLLKHAMWLEQKWFDIPIQLIALIFMITDAKMRLPDFNNVNGVFQWTHIHNYRVRSSCAILGIKICT